MLGGSVCANCVGMYGQLLKIGGLKSVDRCEPWWEAAGVCDYEIQCMCVSTKYSADVWSLTMLVIFIFVYACYGRVRNKLCLQVMN